MAKERDGIHGNKHNSSDQLDLFIVALTMSYLGRLIHSGTVVRSMSSLSRMMYPSSISLCSYTGRNLSTSFNPTITVQTRCFAKWAKSVVTLYLFSFNRQPHLQLLIIRKIRRCSRVRSLERLSLSRGQCQFAPVGWSKSVVL